MPEFKRPGATIHYESVGDGPPLLLIAGTASDNASWGPLLPLLPGRRLILPDNRGSGRTLSDGPITHAEIIADCAALLDHLGLGAVDVVGHSLGGYLGLGLASRYPDRVARLVTMGTAAVSPRTHTVFRDLARLYFILPPEEFFRLLYPWLFSDAFFADPANVAAAARASTEYRHRQSPGDFARQIAAMDHPIAIDLAGIDAPVLAMAGTRDLIAPPDAVAAMHSGLPRHRVVAIAAAHSIHWEAPQAVADAVAAFLA